MSFSESRQSHLTFLALFAATFLFLAMAGPALASDWILYDDFSSGELDPEKWTLEDANGFSVVGGGVFLIDVRAEDPSGSVTLHFNAPDLMITAVRMTLHAHDFSAASNSSLKLSATTPTKPELVSQGYYEETHSGIYIGLTGGYVMSNSSVSYLQGSLYTVSDSEDVAPSSEIEEGDTLVMTIYFDGNTLLATCVRVRDAEETLFGAVQPLIEGSSADDGCTLGQIRLYTGLDENFHTFMSIDDVYIKTDAPADHKVVVIPLM